MKITSEKIKNLNNLYDDLEKIKEELNTAHKHSKEFKNNIIRIKRRSGDEVEIKEEVAWHEIYQLGKATECYEVMKNKYPVVFGKTDEYDSKVVEISAFVATEFNISHREITVRDIFKMVDAYLEYKNGNK
jgi:hypothetical protein